MRQLNKNLVFARLNQHSGSVPPFFWQYSEPQRLADPLQALQHLNDGYFFIFRHFGQKSYLRKAKICRDIARRKKIIFLVGNDMALAKRIKADGVHFSESLAKKKDLTRLRRRYPHWIFSHATHSDPGLEKYQPQKNWDFCIISPLFPTRSASRRHLVNQKKLRHIRPSRRRKMILLGGLNKSNLRKILSLKPGGVAAISLKPLPKRLKNDQKDNDNRQ